jgi:uncharacterized protein YcbK (DUF882 family)
MKTKHEDEVRPMIPSLALGRRALLAMAGAAAGMAVAAPAVAGPLPRVAPRIAGPVVGHWIDIPQGGAPGVRVTPAELVEGMSERRLRLRNVNTGEDIDVAYWKDGSYDADALTALHVFFRDWRAAAIKPVAGDVLDMLCAIDKIADPTGPIHVTSGYRTRATNEMLARTMGGVARESLHLSARAVDFFIPGYAISGVCAHALAFGCGGVGYYPRRGFVHIDNGPVRVWQG